MNIKITNKRKALIYGAFAVFSVSISIYSYQLLKEVDDNPLRTNLFKEPRELSDEDRASEESGLYLYNKSEFEDNKDLFQFEYNKLFWKLSHDKRISDRGVQLMLQKEFLGLKPDEFTVPLGILIDVKDTEEKELTTDFRHELWNAVNEKWAEINIDIVQSKTHAGYIEFNAMSDVDDEIAGIKFIYFLNKDAGLLYEIVLMARFDEMTKAMKYFMELLTTFRFYATPEDMSSKSNPMNMWLRDDIDEITAK